MAAEPARHACNQPWRVAQFPVAAFRGWKSAGYVSLTLYFCMVAAGITVRYLFALSGILPTQRL